LAGRLKEKYVTITACCSLYAALYVGYNGIRVTLGTGKLTMDTAANWPLRENAYRPFRVFFYLVAWVGSAYDVDTYIPNAGNYYTSSAF